jgi:hypothetical protein
MQPGSIYVFTNISSFLLFQRQQHLHEDEPPHLLADLPADENDNRPPANCAVCHRSSTNVHPLQFLPLLQRDAHNDRIVLRHFGDQTGMLQNTMVCVACSQYVCPRSPSDQTQPKWTYSWPAVLWKFLTTLHFADAHSFMRFFAADLRLSWHHSVHHWTIDMQNAFHFNPHFCDKTIYLFNIYLFIIYLKIDLLIDLFIYLFIYVCIYLFIY